MLTGWSLPWLALLITSGVVFDLVLGEVRRWHPLVGFGRFANAIERWLNRGRRKLARGALAWVIVVAPPVAIACWALQWSAGISIMLSAALHVALLYFSLGLRSLRDHTSPIEQALQRDDLAAARDNTARIVSRDTAQADAEELAKAGVESLLENGNDAVFGTLFWFLVAGGPGALLFRLANTLDAMWGYRTPRYLAFGCAAARFDDALNWIPARLTALSYTLLGNTSLAWRCWLSQAPSWPSPNAGPVMAAGAGALGLALGGAASYHGIIEHRPPLGAGRAATGADIGRAWRLVAATTALWIGVVIVAAACAWIWKRGLHA
ncbi:MAG: adenosylcobinamide-phosphate synthase CbiB [Pseudomonadota bacterium]